MLICADNPMINWMLHDGSPRYLPSPQRAQGWLACCTGGADGSSGSLLCRLPSHALTHAWKCFNLTMGEKISLVHLWQTNHSDQGQYGDGQQTQQGWSVSGNKSERNEQLVVALAVGQVGVEIPTQNILHLSLHRKMLFKFVGNSTTTKNVQHLHLWSITQAVWVSVGEREETQELPSVRHPGSCDTPSPSVRPSTVTLWQGVTLCDTKAWHSPSPTNWLAQTINQPGKLKWSQSAHFCLSQHYRWAQESLSRNLLSL